MAKYMYIFHGGAFVSGGLSPAEMQEHLAKWYRWSDSFKKQGHQQIGHPLENRTKTVRGRERSVTDGPYAESKDLVTGTFVFEAASFEEAAEFAKGCPIFEFDGSVEVRPILGSDE